ncbi:MAG: IS66 family insertion sequence element accessory protein TnpA [Planctomycetaceae bacterium]
MARRRREQLRAKWIDRLRRFQKRSGNVEEFCRAEGVSLAMLYRWRQRVAETVPGRVPGSRAKVSARVTSKATPFAAVRIRPVPVTDTALRIVLPNGTRLEVPERNPEVLRLVVEAVLRQTGSAGEER